MLRNKFWDLFLRKTASDIVCIFLLMAGGNNSFIEDGQLNGAALDVFNDERIPWDHLLWKSEEIMIMPSSSPTSPSTSPIQASSLPTICKIPCCGREQLNGTTHGL